ncbi:hypothetical protein ACFIOY_20175 [Bradyrhizobium sp. TZ2]
MIWNVRTSQIWVRSLRGGVLSLPFAWAISRWSNHASKRRRSKRAIMRASPYLFYECNVNFMLCTPNPGSHFIDLVFQIGGHHGQESEEGKEGCKEEDCQEEEVTSVEPLSFLTSSLSPYGFCGSGSRVLLSMMIGSRSLKSLTLVPLIAASRSGFFHGQI